jgi:hypothetical protein
MEFKKWLHLENDQYEVYEEAIAAYTFYHFRQAVNKFFSDGKRKKVEEYMKESWEGQNKPNNGGGIRFYLPPRIGKNTVFPKEMVDLRICVDVNPTPNEDGAGATQGHGIIGIHYNPNILQAASGPNDVKVQNIIATIQYQLYHEATHLMSGQVGDGAKMQSTPWWKYPQDSQEYRNGQLNYYTDAGEVKAHARQYAIMYMNKYPGQKYDPQLLIKLAQELNDNKMMRYAQKLGNPNIQKQFPQFAQKMQKAHELFQGFMQRFVSEKGYRQYST